MSDETRTVTREILETMLRRVLMGTSYVPTDAIDDAAAILSARVWAALPTSTEGLDVERLAMALHADAESIESEPTDWKDCPDKDGHLEFAAFLASEYAPSRRRP